MTGTGPSLEDALALHDLGLAPVPAPADDGKSVEGAVAGFNRWRRRLPRAATERLFRENPGANVAILPHLCRPRLVVVDCDSKQALAVALERHGPTPLVIRTPRGTGWHLYYRAPADGQVRQQSFRDTEGLAMEIKAGPGAVVVAPPSVRPSTGEPYTFLKGDMKFQLVHAGRHPRFAASPKGMAAGGVLPGWSPKRYRKALAVLVQRSFLVLLHKGGARIGDHDLYAFADKGARSAPNTNKTPSPKPRRPQSAVGAGIQADQAARKKAA